MTLMPPAPSLPAQGQVAVASLPFRFIVTGLIALVAAGWGLVPIGAHLVAGTTLVGPVLAVIHLLGLGWLTMVALGASYQLVPVALGVELQWPRPAQASYWLFGAGVAGLVAGFATFRLPLMIGAGLLVWTALALFLGIIGRTLWQIRNWSATGMYLTGAYAALGVTASLAVLILFNLENGFAARLYTVGPPAHAFLAVFGWILPLIAGVSYKLLPMFGLIHGHPERFGRRNMACGAFAAGGTATLLLLESPLWPAFAALSVASLGMFTFDVRRMFKKRLRRQSDIGLQFVYTGLLGVNLAAIAGLWLSCGGGLPVPIARGWVVVGLLMFLGGLSQIVLGYLHKILPFLHWMQRYADLAPHRPVPRTVDLLDVPASRRGYVAFQVGIVGLLGAVASGQSGLVPFAAVALAISITWIAVHLLLILRK